MGAPIRVVDSSTGIRTSKDTNNFYQLMMDSSTALKDYPSRSNSLICSTSYNTADNYVRHNGKTYAVFPFDGTDIVESDQDDFINTVVNVLGVEESLQYIDMYLFRAFDMDVRKASITSLDQLEKAIKEPGGSLFREFKAKHNGQVFQTIANKYFTPKSLELQLKKAGDRLDRDRECWFSGKAVLIEAKVFGRVLGEMNRLGMPVAHEYQGFAD
jgi:hypothetical protein